MASVQVRELATQLSSDAELRGRFRSDARATVTEVGLSFSDDELAALDGVDWREMSDEELLVRIRGAVKRDTSSTS